uniref:Sphingomyelin phosphodiesterase C-terminal domain-containing protein n=1 Tax=Globodera rostochiensis TaxID=31243 RepID=A0A914H9D8_GLORO
MCQKIQFCGHNCCPILWPHARGFVPSVLRGHEQRQLARAVHAVHCAQRDHLCGGEPGLPGVRRHPHDGRILDVENYFLNLSAIVDNQQQQPEWQLLYTAKTEYGLNSLSAEAWNALAQRIEREPEMAQKFNRNFARRADAACDARCVAERVCAIRVAKLFYKLFLFNS